MLRVPVNLRSEGFAWAWYKPIKAILGRSERYVLASLLVVAAFALKLMTSTEMQQEIPFLLFFTAVALSGIYGGLAVGLYATGLSALLSDYFFMPPIGTLIKNDLSQYGKLLLFVLDTATLAGLCGSLKKALVKTRRLEQEAAHDRDNLRLSEERLLTERHKLEAIFSTTPAAMALWRGPELVIEKFNAQVPSLFGTRELAGKTLEEALPELAPQNLPEIFRRVLATGKPYVGHEELVLIAPSAGAEVQEHYFDYTYKRIDDVDGKPYGVYNHSIDVTERVLARRRLEKSEENLRLALRGGQLGTWTMSLDGYAAVGDARFREIHGVGAGTEPLAEAVTSRLHPDDRVRVRAALDLAFAEQGPFQQEYRTRLDNGTYRWVYSRGEPKFARCGKPMSISGVAVDIDERRRSSEVLQEAKDEAERANQAKSTFLANMSHEIRSPIGAIMGFVELLKDPSLPPEEAATYLSIIDRNSTHLLRIIDDVLDLAKVEAGKIVIETFDFSLKAILEDFQSIMSLRARGKGIQFNLKKGASVPDFIRSDPTRMRQILTNMVGNALKFTESGHVDLAVNFTLCNPVQGFLTFTVTDTGRGIADHQRKDLFQAFSQADSSTTRKFGGTGLGLVLAKKLSQAMRGDFRLVGSTLGVGSEFEAVITVAVPSAGASRAELTGEARGNLVRVDLHGMNILLVEDSRDNQILLEKRLATTGARLVFANDGAEGLVKALAEPFDVVLMDIQMPVMDGHEAVRALRKRHYTGPIVALTAHAMKEEQERTRASGFSHFLTKPVDYRHLLELLRELYLRPVLSVPRLEQPPLSL